MPFEADSWAQMGQMTFPEIVKFSNMFPEWAEWKYVQDIYKDKILKPVNLYVHHFGIKPEIIRLSKTSILIKYYTYADILIQIPDPPLGHVGIFESRPMNDIFYSTDKCWQRQFYPLNFSENINQNYIMSNRKFKFYIPWVLDLNLNYFIKNGSNETSFLVEEGAGAFTKSNENDIIKNTGFVNFYFKWLDKNMLTDTCGVIERGSHMFDLIINEETNIIDTICDNIHANN